MFRLINLFTLVRPVSVTTITLTVIIYLTLIRQWTDVKSKLYSSETPEQSFITKENSTNATCQPHTHVFYLKVAKTGSSTLTNILNRKALSLNVRLCKVHDRSTFHSKQRKMPEEDKLKCEIHTTPSVHYQIEKVHQFMRKDKKCIATLRYPFDNFRSKYYFFQNKRKKYSNVDLKGDAIEEILSKSSYDPEIKHFNLKGNYADLRNSMYNYFQLDDIRAMLDEVYFQDTIRAIEEEFSLIFINEYFDESLVLFKRMFCWEIKDIIYIIHKKASYVNKAKRPEEYGSLFEKHKDISSVDYKLYEHFLSVHKARVQDAGGSFADEVEAFGRIKINVSTFCWSVYAKLRDGLSFVGTKALAREELWVDEGEFHPRFSVTGGDCILMAMSEEVFTEAIRAINYPENCHKANSRPRVNRNFCTDFPENFVYRNIPFITVQKTLMKDVVV